jgi:hypothetical protein
VVNERIVAGRTPQGVPAFVIMVAIAPRLMTGFALLFASLFEKPLLSHHRPSGASRPRHRRAEGAWV